MEIASMRHHPRWWLVVLALSGMTARADHEPGHVGPVPEPTAATPAATAPVVSPPLVLPPGVVVPPVVGTEVTTVSAKGTKTTSSKGVTEVESVRPFSEFEPLRPPEKR